MLNVWASDWCSTTPIYLHQNAVMGERGSVVVTAVFVLRVRQNKTTLGSLRLDAKPRDGNRGRSVTIKAQCIQKIRLGCSPKLRFLGMLLSLRLLKSFSQLIQLCMSQKHTFSHNQPVLISCKQHGWTARAVLLCWKMCWLKFYARSSFPSHFVSVSHIRVVVRSRWPPHPGACQ